MPAGDEVTVPVPLPLCPTVSVKVLMSKVAVTLFAASIVTVHAPVPLHAPPQPMNVESIAAAAVSVTIVPKLNGSVQSVPQLMPVPETVPEPVPAFVTVSVNMLSVNVAVTLFAASIVTVHAPVPVHAPAQPLNIEPVPAAAVSVTIVP